jgi:cell division septum initiation protein DivIVA
MSGVAGGVAGAGLLYGIYLMTPAGKAARKVNAAAKEIDNRYQQVAATIKDKTPTTDEAVDKLRQFCYSYVAWVPGGRQYVDSAFNDLEAVRKEHSDEVDKIVSETYKDFQDVASSGLSFESMSKAYDALANLAAKIASLSGSAADQLLERHPQLNDKVGEPIRQLKQMGKDYGPEARKLVDETWSQVNDALSSGFSVETADKVRKIVEERTEQVRKIGDDLWNKGLEQAKPYLDKNPRVKELIEENQDALKQGNVMALFGQLKKLGEGGDMDKLEDYVKQTVDKAKSTGAKAVGGSSSFAALAKVFGTSSDEAGRMIQENVGLLTEVANKHASEGKELLEETRDDLKKLLEEKANKARKIADKAKSGQ